MASAPRLITKLLVPRRFDRCMYSPLSPCRSNRYVPAMITIMRATVYLVHFQSGCACDEDVRARCTAGTHQHRPLAPEPCSPTEHGSTEIYSGETRTTVPKLAFLLRSTVLFPSVLSVAAVPNTDNPVPLFVTFVSLMETIALDVLNSL